jgi:glycosyltransferase involved in cell wall biosynthesis
VRVLIDYRPALRERSGAGEYTHQLVRALAALSSAEPRLELEPTLFSSSWKDRLVPSADVAGVPFVDRRVPVSLLNLAWHRLEWPSAEAITGQRFDVVHSSHPLLMPARDAAQVVTIHDLDFLTHPERTRAEMRRDYPTLARAHAQRADRILVPSRFTAGEIETKLGVAPERLAVCPHGAPDWTPRASAPKHGYVLFFSTLEPRKNVGGLLDAYEMLVARASQPDAVPDLVLAGRATDPAKPWLERIERAPLKGHVHHVGYVAPDDRRALYEGARLLVQPSFEEGFGIAVLEAMTIGVPVVVANRGSLPEVAGCAGSLVDPERADDITRGIQRVLDDDAFAAGCTTRGIARAREFSWADTARRVYETYREAMASRQQRARSA